MFSRPFFFALFVGCLSLSIFHGCSRRPSRVKPPRMNSKMAASEALREYDQDGDGALSPDELKEIPGILEAIENYDTDGDGNVSAAEIAGRIRPWQESRAGMMSLRCLVLLDGKPLDGATVLWKPEAFLGEDIKPASGVTGENGFANMGIDTSDLPSDQQVLVGVQFGIYKIEITHSDMSIPARYNTQTNLGREIAPGQAGLDNIVFVLTSR